MATGVKVFYPMKVRHFISWSPKKYSVGEDHNPSPRAFQEKLTFSFIKVALGDASQTYPFTLRIKCSADEIVQCDHLKDTDPQEYRGGTVVMLCLFFLHFQNEILNLSSVLFWVLLRVKGLRKCYHYSMVIS